MSERGLTGLRRIVGASRAPPVRVGERCELCAAPVPEEHPHVVDLETRGLCCSCRACALLFTSEAAANGRYRTVPERVIADHSFSLSEAQWTALEIPVGLAFVFFNSRLARWVAIYPSPAGPTESELPLGKWTDLASSSPLVASLAPDVEALLVFSPRGSRRFECLLVPIDVCYSLVALIRRSWRGFDGGDEVRAEIDAFFARLRARSRELGRNGGGS